MCAGERHELALIVFGIALREQGWRVTYLGADTPVESINPDADYVVISATSADRLEAAAREIKALVKKVAVSIAGAGASEQLAGKFRRTSARRRPVPSSEEELRKDPGRLARRQRFRLEGCAAHRQASPRFGVANQYTRRCAATLRLPPTQRAVIRSAMGANWRSPGATDRGAPVRRRWRCVVNRTSTSGRRPLASPCGCRQRERKSKSHPSIERKTDAMVASDRRKWLALALLSVVQFMVVLDIAIVNVALPSIQVDLGFSQENLQWVISAYALVFGGFLLLGGRAADLLGRRRIFLAGIVLFTLASLLGGPRVVGGVADRPRARCKGSARPIITPAALSILSTTFTEGRERNIALGVWGAVGGFGAAAGVLLGGILTDALSWEWIFFVNIPVGVAGVHPGADPAQGEPRRERQGVRRPRCGARDGRALVARVRDHARRARTAGSPARRSASSRCRSPCSSASSSGSCGIRSRSCASASCASRPSPAPMSAGFIMGTAMFSMFLMLTLYMQQVLGYSPMKTGVAYLAVAGTAIFYVGRRRAARDAHRREARAR